MSAYSYSASIDRRASPFLACAKTVGAAATSLEVPTAVCAVLVSPVLTVRMPTRAHKLAVRHQGVRRTRVSTEESVCQRVNLHVVSMCCHTDANADMGSADPTVQLR